MTESERDHVHHVALPALRNAQDRSFLQSLFDAVDQCEGEGTCPGEVLDQLDAGLRSKSEIIRSRAAAWLHRLASQHAMAADRLRHLFATGPSTVRLSLVQSIAFEQFLNEPLEREILALALRDKLPRIKAFAADRIRMRGWRDMGPAIEVAAATMLTAAARQSMLNTRRLVVDGYYIRPHDPGDDRVQMVVQFREGTTMLSVPPSTIAALGHAEVARRARLRADWPQPAHEPPGEAWDPIPDPVDLSKNAGLDPELVAARLAFAEFEQWGALSADGLGTLTAILSRSSSDAQQNAAAWLVLMSRTDRKVAKAILDNFDQWIASVRSDIVWNVQYTDELPVQFVHETVRKALRDPDANVRRSAGHAVRARELRTLLPDLIKAQSIDPDPETAASLAENIAFLKDGYIAKRLPGNRYEVRVAIGIGAQQFEMPAKVADAIGFPEIARRVRARRGHKGRRLPGKFWDPV